MRGEETTEKRRKEEEELLGMINEIRTASGKGGADGADDGFEQFIATLLIRICALNNADYVRGYLQGRLDGIKNRKDKEARHDP